MYTYSACCAAVLLVMCLTKAPTCALLAKAQPGTRTTRCRLNLVEELESSSNTHYYNKGRLGGVGDVCVVYGMSEHHRAVQSGSAAAAAVGTRQTGSNRRRHMSMFFACYISEHKASRSHSLLRHMDTWTTPSSSSWQHQMHCSPEHPSLC